MFLSKWLCKRNWTCFSHRIVVTHLPRGKRRNFKIIKPIICSQVNLLKFPPYTVSTNSFLQCFSALFAGFFVLRITWTRTHNSAATQTNYFYLQQESSMESQHWTLYLVILTLRVRTLTSCRGSDLSNVWYSAVSYSRYRPFIFYYFPYIS